MTRYIALVAAIALAGTWTVMHAQTGDCYDKPSHLIHIPGCFDSTFGTNGLVTTSSLEGWVNDVAIQNVEGEQRIVAVGSTWAVARYRSSGALDTTFGVGGIVKKTFTKGLNSLQRVVVQPDNRLVAAGAVPTGKDAVQTLAVTRLLPTGAYDTGFGTGGTVTFAPPLGSIWRGIGADARVTLQSDGKIVVVGEASTTPSGSKIVAIRVTPTGTLDTTFGAGGYFSYVHQAGKLIGPMALAVQTVNRPDGQPEQRIVIVAEASEAEVNSPRESGLVIRLTSNGILDTTFAGSGVARLVVQDVTYFTDVAVDSSNRIVAGGTFHNPYYPNQVLMARYLENGTLDPSFGNGGTASQIWGTGSAKYAAVVIQSDGNVLATGTAYDGTAAWRILPDGSPDRGFGAGGWVTTWRISSGPGLALMQRPVDGYDTFVRGGFAKDSRNKQVWALTRSIR